MAFRKFIWLSLLMVIGGTLLTACQVAFFQGNRAQVQELELSNQELCLNTFIPHKLSFANGMRVREIGRISITGQDWESTI